MIDASRPMNTGYLLEAVHERHRELARDWRVANAKRVATAPEPASAASHATSQRARFALGGAAVRLGEASLRLGRALRGPESA